jgi:hypothetical protein
MNFLSNTLGINNIQNLRRGATGTQKLKNIGAFIGKTVGNVLLAGGLLGGLAKAGSMGASLIREDMMMMGFRRHPLNVLEEYGVEKPSTLARYFKPGSKSLSRDAYNSIIKLHPKAEFEYPKIPTDNYMPALPPHIRYSDLKSKHLTMFQEMTLGVNRRTETLGRIVEARDPEWNAFYRAKKQNLTTNWSQRQRYYETYLNKIKNKTVSITRSKFSVPVSALTDFLEPSFSPVREIKPAILSQRTRELNRLLLDYETGNRAERDYIEDVFDERLAIRRINDPAEENLRSAFIQRSNFQDPFLREKIMRYNDIKIAQARRISLYQNVGTLGLFAGGGYAVYKIDKNE